MFSRRPGFRFNRGRVAVGPVAPGGGGGDTDPPALSSDPAVGATGLYIDFTFDEAMDSGVPPHTAFTLNGTPVLPIAAGSSWQSTTVFRLAVDSPILGSETVTVSCAAGTFKDVALNNHAALSSQATDNNSTAQLTLKYITRMSGLPGNLPTRLGSARFRGWGGGGGGTTNVTSGGSGAFAQVTWDFASGEAFTIAVGAAGAAGGGTGGDTTLNTNQCVAKGAVADTGGLAASSVGDVVRAGANGSVATGGNTIGAGSPGSDSAAVGTTPGDPNGAPGGSANNANSAKMPGGGGFASPTAGRPGAQGIAELRYPDVNDPDYPPIVGLEHTRSGNNTTHVLTIPAGDIGERLLYVIEVDGTPTVTFTDATLVATAASASATLAIYQHLDDDGTPPDTVGTSASESVNAFVVRFSDCGAFSGTAAAQASSATPDTPSHDAGSSAARIWFAIMGRDSSTTGGHVTARPTGYDESVYAPEMSSAAGVQLLVAWRRAVAQTEDPGTWTTSVADTTVTATVGAARA